MSGFAGVRRESQRGKGEQREARMNGVRIVVASVLGAAGALAGCASPTHMSEAGSHGEMCPAIQSAAGIGFSNERAAALKKIAATPGLSEHEQAFVIDVALGESSFSGDRADVLVELAHNPAMTLRTRGYMAEKLAGASMFSGDKQRVTEALASGGAAERK
jgi:hypothetical protein